MKWQRDLGASCNDGRVPKLVWRFYFTQEKGAIVVTWRPVYSPIHCGLQPKDVDAIEEGDEEQLQFPA